MSTSVGTDDLFFPWICILHMLVLWQKYKSEMCQLENKKKSSNKSEMCQLENKEKSWLDILGVMSNSLSF